MKTQRNILIAFILNACFAVFELIGGMIIGSAAIVSDAVHDAGDAISIGISYFLEKKSRKQPDEIFTYGYARFSVLGGFITALMLLPGSIVMIYHAVCRIITPVPIHYTGMMLLAGAGICINFCAALFTREKGSLHQKAVNLHMLEDVLGWAVVLAGSIVMHFTDFAWLDPVLSMGISVFILVHALIMLKEILSLFLEKAPRHPDVKEIRAHISAMEGIMDVHHLHVWSLDGRRNLATVHIITDDDPGEIKAAIRQELHKLAIDHVTIETETGQEDCREKECRAPSHEAGEHCMHHHHTH